MTRIFEVKTICPNKEKGQPPCQTTYRVAALDGEKAIAKAKLHKEWAGVCEKVISVALLAETEK